jgi:GDP-4-dehydro-6-deoxy-D-mannose reductase
MKQIFVTGASGFVGQHFRVLIESTPDWQMVAAPQDFDLRDGEGVARMLAGMPAVPDAVLHLAAQSNVPQAFADPEETFDINFLGTLRLLR